MVDNELSDQSYGLMLVDDGEQLEMKTTKINNLVGLPYEFTAKFAYRGNRPSFFLVWENLKQKT